MGSIEGSDEVEEWPQQREISGATAGQSPLIRALDLYAWIKGV
jgi:hypothetical protein